MQQPITEVKTFGDVRSLILETIMNIRDGGLDISQGMAMAANFKALNDNITCEINAAKLAYLTEEKANSFGRVVHMGKTLIGSNFDDKPALEHK